LCCVLPIMLFPAYFSASLLPAYDPFSCPICLIPAYMFFPADYLSACCFTCQHYSLAKG
jgi:hypothetical protein